MGFVDGLRISSIHTYTWAHGSTTLGRLRVSQRDRSDPALPVVKWAKRACDPPYLVSHECATSRCSGISYVCTCERNVRLPKNSTTTLQRHGPTTSRLVCVTSYILDLSESRSNPARKTAGSPPAAAGAPQAAAAAAGARWGC